MSVATAVKRRHTSGVDAHVLWRVTGDGWAAHRDVLDGQAQRLQQLRQRALLEQALAIARLRLLARDAAFPLGLLLLPGLPPLLRLADVGRCLLECYITWTFLTGTRSTSLCCLLEGSTRLENCAQAPNIFALAL